VSELSDEEVDYLQEPSDEEVEGSSWTVKDPLTETAEHFTNGVGVNMAKERFTRVIESSRGKQQFHDSGVWKLSIELIVLAFLWQLPKIKAHYVGDLFRVNLIIAKELGFSDILSYIETRGWLISKKPRRNLTESTRFTLEYRKLEEAIAAAPAGEDGKLNKNAKAMVDALFVTLKSKEFVDPFSGRETVRFVDKTSFNAKVNQYAQDIQFMFTIVKHFILLAVETEKDNIEYWAKVFFKGCRRRKQLHLFCQNFLVALPKEESAAVSWVKYLLTNHADSLIDETARKASADSYQLSYNNRLEKALDESFGRRGSDRRRKPSDERSLVMVKSRIRDIYIGMLPPEDKSKHPSSTRKRGKK